MNMRGVRTALPMLATVTLVGCGSPTEPGTIDLEPATLEAVGDSAQLTVGSATSRSPWVWRSLDPEIVAVSPSGMARALAPGSATVRATRGDRAAETDVVVLPPTNVRVLSVGLQPDGPNEERMTLRLSNLGGRGFYRLEAWRTREGLSPTRVLNHLTETPAAVGMVVTHQVWLPRPEGGSETARAADFLVVYSRPANEHSTTALCVLLHGEGRCVIPDGA